MRPAEGAGVGAADSRAPRRRRLLDAHRVGIDTERAQSSAGNYNTRDQGTLSLISTSARRRSQRPGRLPVFPGRAMACAVGLTLAGLAAGMLVSPLHTGHDTNIMMLVTQNLLTKASFLVDPDGLGDRYSDYGLGMSLVFIVPYLIASLLHQNAVSWMLLSTSVLFALTLAAVFWLTIGCGATRRQGVATTLLVGFGTLLLPYVPTGMSELGVGLGIAVGLASLTAVPRDPKRAGAVAGAAAGLTALMRADSLLLVVPILAVGAWLLGGRRRPALLAFVAGATPLLLTVAAYNMLRFGAPWRL